MHTNNPRAQQLPNTLVNGINPDLNPVHVNGGFYPEFQHALERDQSEFNELFQDILSSFCSQTGCADLPAPGLQALSAPFAGGCRPLAEHV